MQRTVLLSGLSAVLGARTSRSNHDVGVFNDREGVQDFTVLFHDGTTEATIKSWCDGACSIIGHPDEGGLAFAAVSGRGRMEKLMTKRSAPIKFVEADEQDIAIPIMEEEGDVSVATAKWGLNEIGILDRPTTGKGVHIYVQDTGVRVSHNDFGGRAIPYLDITSGSVVECNGDRRCAQDAMGHGTHCAGTAAGSQYGVASDAKVYATKTLGDGGTGQRAWNIAGIDFVGARGNRPGVISLSLGGAGQDQAYKAAIDMATNGGITVVVAAGNFGDVTCNYSPAFVPSAITVGATTSVKSRAAYSNWGPCNDIMAPGSQVTSLSHIADSMTTKMTGTSMACPHVSGAVALLLEANPSWKRDDVFQHLTEYGRDGYVQGLNPGDPDLFLWVGRNPGLGAPKCPDYAKSTEPNYWGDCDCPNGQTCSMSGGARDCPSAWGVGGNTGSEFVWSCGECKCY